MRRDAAVNPGRHSEKRGGATIRGAPPSGGLLRVVSRNGLEAALCLLFTVVAVPTCAAPRSIADCEAIKDADAYNRCLASFGPMRGQRGAAYPRVATEGGRGGKSNSAARRTNGPPSGAQTTRQSGGRVRMEFTPGHR